MPKTRHVPLGNYADGIYNFGPVAVPNGLDGFDVRVGRCTSADPTIWPNASTILRLDFQFSFDGGATYPLAQFWSKGGGIITQRGGVDLAESVFGWRFQPDEPTHWKAQATVTGGPIRTYIDVTQT